MAAFKTGARFFREWKQRFLIIRTRMSGRFALTQQGNPQNGILRLYDIYNLNLRADLVVLSACQTALGKDIIGEGLVGLTRGFMCAGTPRVAASLWQIDDRATTEFMKRFYEAMLAKGLRPAAALRAAQVSMWRERRWGEPCRGSGNNQFSILDFFE